MSNSKKIYLDHQGAVLHQINISQGGVPKRPIDYADVTFDGVAGDKQGNRAVHGGVDRALCLYSLERIETLHAEGHSIEAGSSGENFTISGLDWAYVKPGDQMSIGSTLRIEITSYAEPCRHNAQWFHDREFKRISQKNYPGWSRLYAKVLVEGSVQSGDSVFIDLNEP